ncbi:ABC-2 type transport system ATP-binding protein [Natranaerovirga pectinivora]|uniref:ABC-2 type transport system ATP-binding protein n=1 Tax=Natranaerovirga pectinivora TaxID=682400 RepID=A0A4R3MIU7_9FIRM|nr:ABC transporter ATP-binding protein [Natranaerovirga pectinivora]TCT13864.1 ABC-2 type transport system ATP-binding protein [Natranaerovirga pectinivora]
MLEVKNLVKKFGSKNIAVNDMSFSINEGEICIILGPNGAGKSTTIKCIAGLLKFSGEINIFEHSNKSIESKKILGYVPETPSLYELLTVNEHLEFIAKAYELKDYEGYKNELLKRFDLDDKVDKVGRELSKGMQQKVSLCCALLIKPKIIMFDEPMIGLDPKAINELKKVFIELKEAGCILLISTHIIDSVEQYWDRVLIMNKGEVVKDLNKESLIHNTRTLEEIFFEATDEVKGA